MTTTITHMDNLTGRLCECYSALKGIHSAVKTFHDKLILDLWIHLWDMLVMTTTITRRVSSLGER